MIATLAREIGDVSTAEDLAQEAFLSAVQQWPSSGIPSSPRAWLLTVARRRRIDSIRRSIAYGAREGELIREAQRREALPLSDFDAVEEEIGDDLLRLIFITCHPLLSTDARVALTLRLVAGLGTDEIARAFLVSESTVAQRIVRAKRTLTEALAPFELPPDGVLTERLDAVLEVIYLVFNEGYVATSGATWTRPSLCYEALRLGRVLAELVPDEPEVHGLVALMEFQASRLGARTGPGGVAVVLADQDRGKWDQVLVRRGSAALERAARIGRGLGSYGLQAAIASCHALAPSVEATDWERVVALYDALATVAPSPVVELNRAVAVSMAYGPAAGLEVLDALGTEHAIDGHHLFLAVRGDLLVRLGRGREAAAAFERGASVAQNDRERQVLTERAAAAAHGGPTTGASHG